MGIELERGVDEVSLALVADAWSRTYRSRAITFAASAGAVETRNGLRVVPDQVVKETSAPSIPLLATDRKPAAALDNALQTISQRYGSRTADLVAMQLEYPAKAF
jgi:transcriptional regulator GlxA family with amidase domain